MPRVTRRSNTSSADRKPVNDVHTDEAEESAPRGRRRSAADEEPKGRSGGGARRSSNVASGWDGYDTVKGSTGEYAEDFKISDEDTLVKFLDNGPFAVFRQHWLNERNGKKSFTCIDEDCPLCEEVGDRPGKKAAFNLVNLRDPDNPVLERWVVGSKVADAIKSFASDRKTSPINREDLYWAVKRTGSKAKGWQTVLTPVKARDLREDWDTDPLDDPDLDALAETRYDADSIEDHSVTYLQGIADEILGND